MGFEGFECVLQAAITIWDDWIQHASECRLIPDHAWALILRRFVARQTRFHSAVTFARPRRLNCRKPITRLTHPNTGSTITFRRLYAALPSAVASLSFIRRVAALVGETSGASDFPSRPSATITSTFIASARSKFASD